VFGVGFKAVRDTLMIAGIATPIAGLFGMIIAFLVVRTKVPGKKLIGTLSILSFAVPGTVIGIGYILAFNHKPLALTGTLSILLLNFVFRYIPVGIESGTAILQQIDPSIEEAAIDLGADARRTFSKITLPMIVPAFFSGLVFAFVRAMTAVSAAIFLVSSRWNLMTVHIMSQVESGNLGAAAAYSVLLVLMSGCDKRYPRYFESSVRPLRRQHASFLRRIHECSTRRHKQGIRRSRRRRRPHAGVRDMNIEIGRANSSRFSGLRVAAKQPPCGWWPASRFHEGRNLD